MKNCQKISQLASRACDEKINWLEHIELKLHFMMCKNCRHFAKNNETLHKIMQAHRQCDK